MTIAPGFVLRVGAAPRRPGVMSVGWHGDADVPFRPGDEFPFEDASARAITVGDFLDTLPLPKRLHVLLECRRVLRPGGTLRVDLRPEAALDRVPCSPSHATDDLDDVAALARVLGLTGHATGARRGDVAPHPGHGATHLDLTKPERRLTGNPLVSVAIPAYRPHYFRAALDSALAQTYESIEIVVGDDSPGPEIAHMAAGVSSRPVRYERNEPRLGTRRNFMRCFERAHGEFVKFLCDDDLLAPHCVEHLLDAFRHAPDVTLATSRRRRIDRHGASLPDQPATMPITVDDALIAGYTLANAMLMAGLNTVGEPSTALFRKSDFLDLAPDYFRFRGARGLGIIDMVMWSVLLLKGNAVYLREALSSFRVHAGQRQHDPNIRERSIASIRELQEQWLALGLHERFAPDQLLLKPFPPGEADWRMTPVIGVAVRRL